MSGGTRVKLKEQRSIHCSMEMWMQIINCGQTFSHTDESRRQLKTNFFIDGMYII